MPEKKNDLRDLSLVDQRVEVLFESTHWSHKDECYHKKSIEGEVVGFRGPWPLILTDDGRTYCFIGSGYYTPIDKPVHDLTSCGTKGTERTVGRMASLLRV